MSRGISTAILVGKVVGDAKVKKERGTDAVIEARAWVNVSRPQFLPGGGEPEWVENLIMVQALGPYAQKLARFKDGERIQVMGTTNLLPYRAQRVDGSAATNVDGHPIERKRLVVLLASPGHQVGEGGPVAMNRVILVGRTGADPEVKSFESGGMTTRINVATDRYDPDGEKDDRGRPKDATTWHSVTIKGKRAEAAAQYIKKGDVVVIEGTLETRTWTSDEGVKGEATAVVSFGFEFGGKSGGGGGNASAASAAQRGWGDDFEDFDSQAEYQEPARNAQPSRSTPPAGASAPEMPLPGQAAKAKAGDPYGDFDDEIPF